MGPRDGGTLCAPVGRAGPVLADLAVTAVTAPQQVIGDPASVTVSWTVENQGLGESDVSSWTDSVVLSGDDVLGNGDDQVVADFNDAIELYPEYAEAYNNRGIVLLDLGRPNLALADFAEGRPIVAWGFPNAFGAAPPDFTGRTIKQGLALLGIGVVEKM